MTITSQKDILFSTFQEFDTAQQTANRARAEMHCIIAALPDETLPEEVSAVSTDHANRPIVHRPKNDCDETPTDYSISNDVQPNKADSRAQRPLVMQCPQKPVSPPDVVDLRLSSNPVSKPPKKRMTSMEKKARTQEAILYHAANSHLTLEQAAIQFGLESKALSRQYAKKLRETMFAGRKKYSKAEADDFLYNEKRQKK